MKIAVRYYTKTGNTKKLAEAIASAIDQFMHKDKPDTADGAEAANLPKLSLKAQFDCDKLIAYFILL